MQLKSLSSAFSRAFEKAVIEALFEIQEEQQDSFSKFDQQHKLKDTPNE